MAEPAAVPVGEQLGRGCSSVNASSSGARGLDRSRGGFGLAN